ncbi:MAG: ATP synthase F1 subunit delta [Candidatus Nephrothrix sp. EaCA]|nr:MAG: ATP synthase F1 subunit delta [Candidatus Nephrothrix sp. EaCA]
MTSSRVIHRYVKALFDLAVEKEAVEAVHADMRLMAAVCQTSRDFVSMLRSPIIHQDKKTAIVRAIFKKSINPLSMSMTEMIIRKRREPLLPEMAAYFHTAYNNYKNIAQAALHSAVPMDEAQLLQINALVKALSKKSSVDLEKKTDSSLIGGFVLDVGDKRIDASVKNKLQALAQQFAKPLKS